MNSIGIVSLCLALSIACTLAQDQPTSRGLDPTRLPLNTAALIGDRVVFTCWADPATPPPHRIQWTEYAHTPAGGLISDGKFLLPAHPQANRYELASVGEHQYDLVIKMADLLDGGTYICNDAAAPVTQKHRHAAQLIVMAGDQNCTTTIPQSGSVVEDQYYTSECVVDFRGNIFPNMRWFGPQPFGQAQSSTPTRVWSGKSFYAHRTQQSQYFTSTVNFTSNFLPVPQDTADNIPTYTESWDNVRLFVQWAPKNMYADPVKPLNEYEVGDVLECYADAFPTASFQWHNMRTNERIDGSLFEVTKDLEGTEQTMRCEAANLIDGLVRTTELQIEVKVPLPTTPTTPSTTPTTTPPPAWADCYDFTGRWQAFHPLTSQMCVEVDKSNGNVHAVLRNHTDTFWVDMVGITNTPDYHHLSLTGIWPLNRAVSTFIAECSRCHGEEHLIVNAISRSKGGPPCATPGEIYYSQEYHFFRNPEIKCPPITIPTFSKK